MNPTLLIVDDEKHTRDGLRRSLEDSFEVFLAGNAEAAALVLEQGGVDVLLTDLRLGGESGMKVIERALALSHPPVCVMMTAYGSVDAAVEAMRRGAADFITKPLNIDELEIKLKRALRERRVESENRELREQVDRKFGLENLIGESAVMEEVFATIRQVAPSRATVLIQGESGTGKELVARAVHTLSPRARGKFVAVHCAALSPQLLESELFGHEKGAFTGAVERRLGRFEQADGGPLFLDEIGEIDAATQVKILRVLGERTFERVGGNQPLKVDVRLVAATNKDLEKLVAEGKFRDDLFFRLNVVQVWLPPLRDRREDIPLLVQAFLREAGKENGKPVRELTSEAMARLIEHAWPGNVRELRAAIEHAVVMANGPKITLRDLPMGLRAAARGALVPDGGAGGPGEGQGERFNLHEAERRLILAALEECRGNRSKAAERLGISRRTLHRKLHELNLPEA